MARSYDLEFRLARASRLNQALNNKHWTRTLLAEKTGYDEKTIRNLLAGEVVRDQTIIDVSQALGIAPELVNTIQNIDVSGDDFGGYTRSTHATYESYFHLYRRSFSENGKIFRGVVQIRWEDSDRRFNFLEYYIQGEGDDASIRFYEGPVYMSSYTSLMHFLTIFQGSVRLATMVKMRERDGTMRGALLTQYEGMTFVQPTVTPVIMKKLTNYDIENKAKLDIGFISTDDADYGYANHQLALTEKEIVKAHFA